MALDLSALDEPTGTAAAEPTGEPLVLLLDDVIEDPNQPRTEFNQEALEELAASIALRGVKSPISVKPADQDGKYIINHGARRYRASIMAGKITIPAFIDEEHDDYDQVIENIQRDNLTPLDIARFIEFRLTVGEKAGQIAEKLGKKASFVTYHQSLINMPDYLLAIYEKGICRDARTFYEAMKAHEEYDHEFAAYLDEKQDLTRSLVKEFMQRQKILDGQEPEHKPAGQQSGIQQTTQSNPGSSVAAEERDPNTVDLLTGQTDSEAQASDGEGFKVTGFSDTQQAGSSSQNPVNSDDGSGDGGDETGASGTKKNEPDPDKIRKPIVQVTYDERPARLILDKRTENGLAWIKYDDDGSEDLIEIGLAYLVAIIEGA